MTLSAAVVGLAVLLALVLSASGPFLSNDGPTHAYAAYVHAHFDDDALAFPRFVTLNDPPTARGYDLIFRAFEPALGPVGAMHAAAIVVAELWALAFVAFTAALCRRRAAVGLLGFPCALQSTLYLGFFPFVLGSAFAFLTLAVFVRRPVRIVDALAAGALLFLAARCHPIAAGLGGALAGVVALAQRTSSARLRSLALLFLASTPALWSMWSARGAAADHIGTTDVWWSSALERTLFVLHGFQPGGAWRPLFALALALAGVAILAARARRREAPAVEVALGAAALVLLTISTALPRDFMQWQLASTRLLPMATMILFALLATETLSRRVRAAVAVAAVVYSMTSFAWGAATQRAVAQATRHARAGLGNVRPDPRDWLPLVVEVEGDQGPWDIEGFAPLFHVADLYAMELGGVSLFSQSYFPSIHGVLRAHPSRGETPPTQDYAWRVHLAPPALRADALRRALAVASTHEGIIMYATPADVSAAVDAGFRASYNNGKLFIGRFEGCTGTWSVDGFVGTDRPLRVQLGWWPRRTPTLSTMVAAANAHDQVALGCGDVWLAIEGRRCAEGVPVRATFTPNGNNALRCTLVSQP
jgi:hypothetical protein